MHQLPRSTVAGGHVPASCSAVLPPTLLAFLTVGIAAAGNFLLAPSSRMPPAWGFELIGCPANALVTAWRAASARPVVEKASATSAMISAGEGVRLVSRLPTVPPRRLTVRPWDRAP